MAAGKSAVGRRLARRLKWRFVDLDRAIEAREKMTVRELFEHKGEPYFRKAESEVLREILKGESQVVATGGGAVVNEENLRLLKEKSWLICLTASTDILLRRAGGGRERPLLEGENPRERIEELLGQRERVYAQAHLGLDTSALTVDQVVEEILRIAKGEGIIQEGGKDLP